MTTDILGKQVRIICKGCFNGCIGTCVELTRGTAEIRVESTDPLFKGKDLKFFSGEYEIIS